MHIPVIITFLFALGAMGGQCRTHCEQRCAERRLIR
jgi:hypothetical protein